MYRLYDIIKQDCALQPISLATASATSEYYRADDFRRIGFIVNADGMAATNTVVCQVVQATDGAGTSSKNIAGVTCTITANTKVKIATATLASVVAAETVVINGLTFTAHATTTTVANREFSIAGSDTQDAAELVTCINDATYGVPGVTASNVLGVVTLVATEPGDLTITIVGDTNITAATVKADALLEINSCQLDKDNGFDHAAITLTTNATIIVCADIIRDVCRYNPTQYVAASSV